MFRTSRSGTPAHRGLYTAFACAWALATLFHYEFHHILYYEGWVAKVTAAVAAAAAFFVLARPADVRALAALALAHLIDVARLLPEVPNHWLLAALVDVTWLVAIADDRRRHPDLPLDGGRLLAAVRGPLLAGVVLFYLWTGFWKLNHDFFRTDVSCAVVSWKNLIVQSPWLPDARPLRLAVIWMTLLMELLGPLLLLLPRTRRAGVVLFVLFHVGLGLDVMKRFVNFSSVMFALLLLFLPPEAPERVRHAAGAPGEALARSGPWLARLVYALLLLAGLAVGPRLPVYWLGRWVVWLGYAVVLVCCVMLAAAVTPAEAGRGPRPAAVAWLFPVLVVLNGLSPVLGLKNRTSWQMYSNLRLEAEASNHLLVPRSLDVFGALADRVVVRETTAPALRPFAGTGLDLTWIEFRRLAAADPGAAVVYERGGTVARVTRIGDVLSPPPPLVRKLMFFRPLGAKVVESCVW